MANRLRTPLSERLRLDIPVFQAPIASVTTAALAAAVSKTGGLGGFGCAYMQPDAMRKEVAAFRAITDRPFQLEFLLCAAATTGSCRCARRRYRGRNRLFPGAGLAAARAGGVALRARSGRPT